MSGRDRGPAGELGLERRDRGDGLWCRADPQEARFVVLLDRRIEHLCEERHQRIVPADDDRQAWVLCGNADSDSYVPPWLWVVWGRAVRRQWSCAWPVHQVPSATSWLYQVP